jgi:hypothetical protein
MRLFFSQFHPILDDKLEFIFFNLVKQIGRIQHVRRERAMNKYVFKMSLLKATGVRIS